MTQRYQQCFLLLIFCVLASPAVAISIEPGQWKMDIAMTMPMMPEQKRSHTDCIEEAEFDPEDIAMDPNSACQVRDIVEEGNSLSWGMDCPGVEGTQTGSWTFVSHGDSIS